MTSTWLSRQPSHTGGPTAAAALLARADTVANLARVHESPVPLPEYFFHEERLIWRRHDPVSGRQDPILGDVRGAVMSQLRLQRLHDWARAGTQGVLIRRALQAHPDSARTLLDACMRASDHTRSARNPNTSLVLLELELPRLLAPDLPSSGSLHMDLNYTHCHYRTVKARYGYFLSLPHCVRIG